MSATNKPMSSANNNISKNKKRKRSDESDSSSESDVEGKKTNTNNKNKKLKVATDPEKAQQLKQALKDHESTVNSAQKENKTNETPGKIRANKLPHRMDKSIKDKSWPKVDGYKNIGVCSGSPGIFKELSPMKLGPIKHEETGLPDAKNLENLWQYSKVFSGDVDSKGTILPSWYARRKQGFADAKPHRRAKKLSPGEKTLYSYWKGEKLDYMEARKKIYCPLFAEYVVKTAGWKKLKELMNDGYNIQILGYDGYDYVAVRYAGSIQTQNWRSQTRRLTQRIRMDAVLTSGDNQKEPLHSSVQLPVDCWNTILGHLTNEKEIKIKFISSASKHMYSICKTYKQSHGIRASKATSMQQYFASKGYLSCLKYAHENGCPWDEDTCSYAALNGQLECLKYAHENGCPWNEKTCSYAALNGQLECLKYAHENGCPWDKRTWSYTAMNGHLECLKYAHENGCPRDKRTCSIAAENGKLECLKYAHENGCPWEKYTCTFATENGHLECLKYAHENGCPCICNED